LLLTLVEIEPFQRLPTYIRNQASKTTTTVSSLRSLPGTNLLWWRSTAKYQKGAIKYTSWKWTLPSAVDMRGTWPSSILF